MREIITKVNLCCCCDNKCFLAPIRPDASSVLSLLLQLHSMRTELKKIYTFFVFCVCVFFITLAKSRVTFANDASEFPAGEQRVCVCVRECMCVCEGVCLYVSECLNELWLAKCMLNWQLRFRRVMCVHTELCPLHICHPPLSLPLSLSASPSPSYLCVQS